MTGLVRLTYALTENQRQFLKLMKYNVCKCANKIPPSGVRWNESINSENIVRLQNLLKTNRC